MASKNKKVILRMSVPRNNVRGPMAFEQVLANLHGLLLKEISKSGEESISFEIVRNEKRIFFYIIAPRHLRTLIASQIYAQYPDVEIEETKEYFTKKLVKGKKLLLTNLIPSNLWLFPFKRHPQFADKTSGNFEDPIGPISSALSQLHSLNDSAIIQFVISPVDTKWNKIAEKNLKKIFRSGAWEWEWFRNLFQWAKLSPNNDKRKKRKFAWFWINILFGWTGQDDENVGEKETTSGSHEKETTFAACYDKLTRLNFATNIRMLYIHSDPDNAHAEAKIREMAGTFQQFSLPQLNHFTISELQRERSSQLFRDFILRRQNNPFVLSQEEVATMYHLPTEIVSSSRIQWVDCPKLEPPVDLPDETEKDVTLLGETNFRNDKQLYGIRTVDRRRHTYIIGKTGMGKSTLLENMIYSDIMAGRGVGVIDPHGDLAEAVLRFVPKNRTNDVIYFDPSDSDFPIAFNMLEGKDPAQRGLIASGLVGVIKKLNIDSWGPRLEHFLRNTILSLVEAPDTTMLGITRILVDPAYQAKVLHFVKDPMVQSFWHNEFNKLAPQRRAEAIGPIQNKVGQFLSTPIIRNIVGQPKSTLDLRFAMDTGKIVIINLSKGKIGEDNSSMLGSLLITKFQLDAMSRANIQHKDRRDFYLYVDEFQNFATDSFATILSEARKYKLNLTMANQYVAQMSDEVKAAVFGNVGSLISFQVGIDDAKTFAQQFDEDRVDPINLASIPKYNVYNRIMVDGMTTPVFSAQALPPPSVDNEEDQEERKEKIIKFSRQRYAKPREIVEDKIIKWTRSENEKRPNRDEKEQNTNYKKPNTENKPSEYTKKTITKEPIKPIISKEKIQPINESHIEKTPIKKDIKKPIEPIKKSFNRLPHISDVEDMPDEISIKIKPRKEIAKEDAPEKVQTTWDKSPLNPKNKPTALFTPKTQEFKQPKKAPKMKMWEPDEE